MWHIILIDMNKDIFCPNCNNKCLFFLDEWGYTPIHLHCDNCHIDIGANGVEKCKDLLKEHHWPNTYLEYYGNEIQLLIINDKKIIDNLR